MALLFSVRGDAYNARYSTGYNSGIPYNSANISIAAGDLGSVMDLSSTAVIKYVSWSAMKNTPNGRTISLLIRFAPAYTGAPAATRAILELNTGASGSGAFLIISHAVTTGNLVVNGRNQAGQVTFNSTSFGAWSPTSGTYYDLLFQWDGTTTANAGKVYIDNSLLGQATASNALDSSWDNNYWKSLAVGAASGLTTSALKLSELVIWDTTINPASVALVSGTGALNGASRTSYVDAASFNGSSYTDPGVANVLSTANYTYAGTSQTGTYVVASAANVKTGVTFGVSSGSTGTYDGSDRWSDPGVANVAAGVSYKANSTTNNRTGTLVGGKGNLGTGRIG